VPLQWGGGLRHQIT